MDCKSINIYCTDKWATIFNGFKVNKLSEYSFNELSLSLGPRTQTHIYVHSHAAFCNLHGKFEMHLKNQHVFRKLDSMPKSTSGYDKLILENFVVISYDQSSAGK